MLLKLYLDYISRVTTSKLVAVSRDVTVTVVMKRQ